MCVFVSMQLWPVVLELYLSAINSPAKNIGVILTHLVVLIMVFSLCVCARVRACVRACESARVYVCGVMIPNPTTFHVTSETERITILFSSTVLSW